MEKWGLTIERLNLRKPEGEHFIMKKFLSSVLTIVVIAAILVTPISVSAADGGEYIQSVFDMIVDMYKGDLDNQAVYEKMIRNMFESLDEFTEYYDLEEAEVLFQQLENSVEGIGIMVSDIAGGITIVEFLEDSPAREAGLMIGDVIVSADDKDLTGMTSTVAVNYIKGKSGTTVRIGVKRGGSDKILYFDVVRKHIVINPVTLKFIDDRIAYIKISTFSFDADVFFDRAMEEVKKAGIDNIILDLRNNGGGSVQAAVNVAKHFVPGGVISVLDYESDRVQDIVYTNDLTENPYNLVVLVNKYTASSSELLAGAIRDTYCGTVIGEKTWGKSVFQQLIPIVNYEAFKICYDATKIPMISYYDLFEYGIFVPERYIMGYLKLTVGEYLTPAVRRINNVGVRPHKVILNILTQNDVNIESLSTLYEVKEYNPGDKGPEILLAKYILKAAGYQTELNSDTLDERASEIIKQYQKDNGLTATGSLNFETQKALNRDVAKMKQDADKQLRKAIDILSD
jgi:carboxyl-terminal processing protease